MPKCLIDCPPYNPDHPPLKVIYFQMAINDKLEVRVKSEEVRTA